MGRHMRDTLFFLFFVLIFCFPLTGSAVEKAGGLPGAGIPPLIESIRFSGPVKVCGQKIPHQDPQVRERLEKEMLLALWDRPQVILWMKRASRFFPHIERILKEENLPEDLKYVAVVESALRAYSRSGRGAVGYWQFLRSTGKKFGLRIDNRVDERRNLFKSTRAAARYFKKLNQEFGSYLLALAAYNMGEFGLAAEIEIQGSRRFFDLHLPLETQRYVLKIAAAKLIMENPEDYGFHLRPEDLYPEFSYSEIRFTMKDEIPLALIAQAAQISYKTLMDYNPELKSYDLPRGKITVLVPKGKEKGMKDRFEALHKKWKNKDRAKYHIVGAGESLTGIAQDYGISLTALLRLNRFSYDKVIHPGDRIRVR